MPHRRRRRKQLAVVISTLFAGAYAKFGIGQTQQTEYQLPEVRVQAERERKESARDVVEERHKSPVSVIIYDRKDLGRYNETTVGGVLRKLPGVTFSGPPGRDEDIRLRGFDKGYTQFLINGERVLGGENERQIKVDLLPAEMIERIEILHNPGAGYEANGIAGTVNIVLRDIPSRPGGDFRIGANSHEGKTRPQVSGVYHGSQGNFSFLLSGSYGERFFNKSNTKQTEEFNPADARPMRFYGFL